MRPSNFWKYHASISGSAIFISSDGWKRATPRFSQRREPLTTIAEQRDADQHQRRRRRRAAPRRARASAAGCSRRSTSARRRTPRLIAWLVTRATLWSAAENSVTRPTPTIASAQPNSIESMRRVEHFPRALQKLPMRRRPQSLFVVAAAGHDLRGARLACCRAGSSRAPCARSAPRPARRSRRSRPAPRARSSGCRPARRR